MIRVIDVKKSKPFLFCVISLKTLLEIRMEGGHIFLFFSVIALCVLPSLQQGWNGNNAAQPTWQAQPVAAAPGGQSAQQQGWNQPQQQPQTQNQQSWGNQPAPQQSAGAAQQSWSNQQTQGAQPTQAPSNRGSGVGVRMLTLKAGDGKTFPSMGQNVTVHYTGKLYRTGQEFDSSLRRGPFTFTLGVGQVIRGWDIAVAHLTLKQKARFTVGPEYAYGAEGIPGTIPANAVLVFDVELLSIDPVKKIFKRSTRHNSNRF